jgi:lysyl-tRNA synthetase class 1
VVHIERNIDHWALNIAEKVIKRTDSPTIATGTTPSGIMHIGNLKDVLTGWYIYQAINDLGNSPKLIWICDDFDALRKVPGYLSNSDGEIVPITDDQKKLLDENLGKPLRTIEDPFGCHDSYAEHFVSLFKEELKDIGIYEDVNIISSYNDLYGSDILHKGFKIILENANEILEIVNKYRTHKLENPFSFIQIRCPVCGKMVGKVTKIYEDGKVEFECTGKDFAGRYIKGCGFKGEVDLFKSNTFKLDWKLDWANRWYCLGVDAEPFGKEHATYGGSWTVSSEIIKNIYKREPPVPAIYEFFLVNGEKMSSSKGNCYTAKQMLEIIEVPVFIFFYGKRLNKQWNLDLSKINNLVQEYDRIESLILENNINKISPDMDLPSSLKSVSDQLYAYYLANKRKLKPIANKIDYNFGAILVQLFDIDKAIHRYQEIKGINMTEDEIEYNKHRLKLIKNWIENYGPEFLKIELKSNYIKLSKDEIEYLKYILENLGYKTILDIINEYSEKIPKTRQFEILYNILIGKSKGPRITTIIDCYGIENVKKVIENYLNKYI